MSNVKVLQSSTELVVLGTDFARGAFKALPAALNEKGKSMSLDWVLAQKSEKQK